MSVDSNFNQWTTSNNTFDEMAAQKEADETGYTDRLKEYDTWAKGKDPMYAIQVLFTEFLMSSNTNATMFGVGDDEIGMKGAALGVASNGNATYSSIAEMVQDKSKDPNQVKDFAKDLDRYLDFLDTKVNTPGNPKMDPSELTQIRSSVLKVRQMIEYKDDPSPYFKAEYNGGPNALINPDEPSTDPTKPTTPGEHVHVQTFYDLFAYAGMKDEGLQSAASMGIKTETNATSTIETNFGAVNQTVKAELQTLTATQKTELGWYDTGALHMITDVIKAVINNLGR